MPLVTNGDVYKIRAFCYDTPLTQVCINSIYHVITGVGAGSTVLQDSYLSAISALFGAWYKPLMGATAGYRGASLQLVSGALPYPVPITSITGNGAGTAAGNNLPLQVSYVVSLPTALSGKHYRGRIYPGFPPASFSDVNGAMNAGGQAAIATFAANFLGATSITITGYTITGLWAVRAFIKGHPPAPNVIAYNSVTTPIGQPRWATQRRRGQYGRINNLPF